MADPSDSRWKVDFSIEKTLADKHWRLNFWGRNIFADHMWSPTHSILESAIRMRFIELLAEG